VAVPYGLRLAGEGESFANWRRVAVRLTAPNEAFAAQTIAVLRDLHLDPTDPRINPNGGAIALGHPLGLSGARIVMTVVEQLHRSRGRFALACMCVGVGQGIAVLIERV